MTYATELHHFADVVEGKAVPKLSHDDARKAAIISDAATKSGQTGLPVSPKYD